MHTDEYEITLGREITLCRKRVRQLREALAEREKQFGLTTEAFLQAQGEKSLAVQLPVESWKQEYQELQYWEKALREYEAVLKSLKRL